MDIHEFNQKLKFIASFIVFLTAPFFLGQPTTHAQGVQESKPDTVSISVDEAIEIALVNNYMLRRGELDIDLAEAQIREAKGSIYPQLNATGSYTRNVKSPNPFAGSDAGGLFESFGAIDWLAFNENARTDGDPNTDPIPFDEFLNRQQQGYEDAGIAPVGAGSNPFAVENQFEAGITINQTIYNGAAFAAIQGARQLREVNSDQADIDRQQVVHNVQRAYYSALLVQEQARILGESVERLRKTVEDTRKSVEAGFRSKFDRVSAEVELVNLETNLIESENRASLARKNLALELGISTQRNLVLSGVLDPGERSTEHYLSVNEAYELAMQRRPDVKQADGFIDLLDVERRITRAQYAPNVSAFANALYTGQVPSNRTSVNQVEGQEFTFESRQRGFFDDSYWDPVVAVGVRLNWTIFNGFQTKMRVQQNTISIRQAEIDREMQHNAIYLEIDQAIRNLETAMRRINSQERNLEQAELNYEFAVTRLQEGAGTALEERQASSLLDESQLNYLSAVHDYLIAKSEYDKAIGKPVSGRYN